MLQQVSGCGRAARWHLRFSYYVPGFERQARARSCRPNAQLNLAYFGRRRRRRRRRRCRRRRRRCHRRCRRRRARACARRAKLRAYSESSSIFWRVRGVRRSFCSFALFRVVAENVECGQMTEQKPVIRRARSPSTLALPAAPAAASSLQVAARQTRASVGNCLSVLGVQQIEGGAGYNRARRRSTRHLDQLLNRAINFNEWSNKR